MTQIFADYSNGGQFNQSAASIRAHRRNPRFIHRFPFG
jgi:hypothetical protein